MESVLTVFTVVLWKPKQLVIETASCICDSCLGNRVDEVDWMFPKENEPGNPQKILQGVRHVHCALLGVRVVLFLQFLRFG